MEPMGTPALSRKAPRHGGVQAPCRRPLTGEARGGSYWDASPGMQAPVRGTREYTVTPLPCLWWDRHGPKQRASSATDPAGSACALRVPLDRWSPGAYAGEGARACSGQSVPRCFASLLARLYVAASRGSPISDALQVGTTPLRGNLALPLQQADARLRTAVVGSALLTPDEDAS